MRNFNCILLLMALFVSCSDSEYVSDGSSVSSPVYSAYDPHVPNGKGPWFEGWYTRITDKDGARSIAVICGLQLPKDQSYTEGMYLPGYIAVFVRESDSTATKSYEIFPDKTTVLIDGKPVTENPDLWSPADFEWQAPGFGSVTENSIDITIPDVITIKATMTDRIPWSEIFPESGPEGVLLAAPIPLHWFVSSVGSKASYEYSVGDGPVVTSEGFAHMEKNWGGTFPHSWVWAQGTSGNNTSHFALAGGKIKIGPALITPWFVGYRSPSVAWNFNPAVAGTVYHTEIDACSGNFYMEAKNPAHTLIIEASADPDTFAPVSIPTSDGWKKNGGVESFSSTIKVRAYTHSPIGGLFGIERLVDKRTFRNAVIEFGAGYICQELSE